ncbi:MAG: DinB family protein [SAR202 cluster bacterium]|nr:DinB family protein [SAR202 cluster bacterium]
MKRQQLLDKLDREWGAFSASYAGLTTGELEEHGAVGEWSVKDILGHVTTWEDECIKALKLFQQTKRPPRYGGVDKFNAVEWKRGLPLRQVVRELQESDQRTVAFIGTLPEQHFAYDRPFRHRIRLDTYGHYPEHTGSFLAWRKKRGT